MGNVATFKYATAMHFHEILFKFMNVFLYFKWVFTTLQHVGPKINVNAFVSVCYVDVLFKI